jgi:hypothetical protein
VHSRKKCMIGLIALSRLEYSPGFSHLTLGGKRCCLTNWTNIGQLFLFREMHILAFFRVIKYSCIVSCVELLLCCDIASIIYLVGMAACTLLLACSWCRKLVLEAMQLTLCIYLHFKNSKIQKWCGCPLATGIHRHTCPPNALVAQQR